MRTKREYRTRAIRIGWPRLEVWRSTSNERGSAYKAGLQDDEASAEACKEELALQICFCLTLRLGAPSFVVKRRGLMNGANTDSEAKQANKG